MQELQSCVFKNPFELRFLLLSYCLKKVFNTIRVKAYFTQIYSSTNVMKIIIDLIRSIILIYYCGKCASKVFFWFEAKLFSNLWHKIKRIKVHLWLLQEILLGQQRKRSFFHLKPLIVIYRIGGLLCDIII